MEGNLGATYALIYQFLKKQSQEKAAEAVKKAAKSFVVLRDDIEQDGPSLEEIIKEWKETRKVAPKAESSSEDSDSSDDSSNAESSSSSDSSSEEDSSSESDSDDSSESFDEATEAKEPPKQPAERDTSVTLSSAEDNAKAKSKIPEKKHPENKREDESPESDSSHSESSDSESSDPDSESNVPEKKPAEAKGVKAKSSDSESTSSGSSSSSTSSDSGDEGDSKSKAVGTPNKTKAAKPESSSSSSSSDSDSDSGSEPEPQQKDDTRVAKKLRTSESGAAVTTAVADTSQQSVSTFKKEKQPPKVRERFQRVKVRNLPPEMLLDNGYEMKGGTTNDYGSHAHRDLIVTRGAGFRKEKNKKKRGSYRGGEITMENHSIKFDY